MTSRRQKLTALILTAFLATGLLATGALIGYGLSERSFRRHFVEVLKAETLGGVLGETPRKEIARVFLDPQAVESRFDGISWSVPNVPTPFVGTAPSPGMHANATINSHQCRNSDEIEDDKGERVRVFLIGGSTAFGVGAPTQDATIGAYLEQILNRQAKEEDGRRYEVWTMANPSWSSTQERIIIENRLLELDPDLVISLSSANDVHWGNLGRNVLWFRTYQDELFWMLAENTYRAFGKQQLVDVEDRSPARVPPARVAERLLRNVRLGALSLGMEEVPYLYAMQPTIYGSGKKLSPRESGWLNAENLDYFRACFREISARLEGVADSGFDFIRLDSTFDAMSAEDEVFLDSYHFGDRGNLEIAEKLAEATRGILESN